MTERLYYRTTHGAWKASVNKFHESSCVPCDGTVLAFSDQTPIVVALTAKTAVHDQLVQAGWHQMSLVMLGTALCPDCVTALGNRGISSGDTMYSASKKLAAFHKGLAIRRF
jgi:hypothetical protein